MDEDMHMILEGAIAELIVKLEPSLYRKHIWYMQKGKPMLYVQLKRRYMALYKQPYCSGGYYQTHYRTGVSRLIHTTNVSPIRNKRKAMYNTMARRRFKKITRQQRSSRRHYKETYEQIRSRQPINC